MDRRFTTDSSLCVITHDEESLRSFSEPNHSLACQDYFIGLLRGLELLPAQQELLRTLIPESCRECPNLSQWRLRDLSLYAWRTGD